MGETSLVSLVALVLAAAAAGFVDAIAGGGGLITVPALLLQVSGVQALATNKLQGALGTLSASVTMVLAGQVDLRSRRLWKEIGACFAGALAGAGMVRLVPPEYLDTAIVVVLSATCVFFLFARNPGVDGAEPRVSRSVWHGLCLPSLGFYDGYFGPGAGMFYQLGQVAIRGRTLIAATANAKLMNFASNAAALTVFVVGGDVVWPVGLVMMAGQAVGGWLGARAALAGGSRLIRVVIVLACLAMLGKFAWDALVD